MVPRGVRTRPRWGPNATLSRGDRFLTLALIFPKKSSGPSQSVSGIGGRSAIVVVCRVPHSVPRCNVGGTDPPNLSDPSSRALLRGDHLYAKRQKGPNVGCPQSPPARSGRLGR